MRDYARIINFCIIIIVIINMTEACQRRKHSLNWPPIYLITIIIIITEFI